MGRKVELFIVDYEPAEPVLIHGDSEAILGEGTLCGIKYCDYVAPNSTNRDRKGRIIFIKTFNSITCPHCIKILENGRGYKKIKGEWK